MKVKVWKYSCELQDPETHIPPAGSYPELFNALRIPTTTNLFLVIETEKETVWLDVNDIQRIEIEK